MKPFIHLKRWNPVESIVCIASSSVKWSLSPAAGVQQAASRVMLSMCCFITTSPSEANGHVLPRQPVLKARLGPTENSTHEMIDMPCTLPGLAALFLWVYYSILGWTEWPSERHGHSVSKRSCQTNQLLYQSRWHSLLSVPRPCDNIHKNSHQS